MLNRENAYMCTHTHAYTYARSHTHTHARTHTLNLTPMYTRTQIHSFLKTHTYVFSFLFTLARAHTGGWVSDSTVRCKVPASIKRPERMVLTLGPYCPPENQQACEQNWVPIILETTNAPTSGHTLLTIAGLAFQSEGKIMTNQFGLIGNQRFHTRELNLSIEKLTHT